MIFRRDLPFDVAESAFSIEEPGEIAVCTLLTGAVAAIRLEVLEPERPASFEEAREDIVGIVQRSLENEFIESLVDSLKDVYPYEVNTAALSVFWNVETAPEGSED